MIKKIVSNLYHIKDNLSINLFKNLGLFRDEEN